MAGNYLSRWVGGMELSQHSTKVGVQVECIFKVYLSNETTMPLTKNLLKLYTDSVSVNKMYLTDSVSVNKKYLTDSGDSGGGGAISRHVVVWYTQLLVYNSNRIKFKSKFFLR